MTRIAKRRIGANLTQQQLAKVARVRQASISDWECGKKEPTLASLRKIARALKTEVSNLL